MADFTEVTREGWFQRLGKSFGGVLIGLLLFIAAFPVLFLNEGSEVKRIQGLKEGASVLVEATSGAVDPALEGKLVHLSGTAVTKDILQDSEFGVTVNGVGLERKVLMYQWEEKVSQRTEKEIGGGEKTIREYSYVKSWNSSPIDSTQFKKPEGHSNPASMRYVGKDWSAANVTVGAYQLNASQIGRVGSAEALTLETGKKYPILSSTSASIRNNEFYLGRDPDEPRIGDLRVSYTMRKPGPVTLIAKQTGSTFAPFATKSTTIDLLKNASMTSDEMFAAAVSERKTLTWILRLVGFLMMFIGLTMILKPLSTIMDVLPILGNITGMAAGLISFLAGLGLSLITIAVAWIFYRPLIGIPLLIAGIAALVLPRILGKKNQPKPVN